MNFPRPNKYNKQNLNKDLLKFYRNIKLRAHFGSTENNSNEPRFKSNSNWLDFDPTELHTEKIKSEINNLKDENLLTLRTANSLLEEKIKIPDFHLLPKIHKANNPGRPVISSVNCHASRISEFVDYYLQPEVKKLKSYVKDTTDFIKKIEAIDHVSDDSYLVS